MVLALAVWLFLAIAPASAQTLDQLAAEFVEEATMTALTLTDSDALALGVMDFDPNVFFEVGDIIGSDVTLESRQTISTWVLPWSSPMPALFEGTRARLKLRLYYLKIKQNLNIWQNPDLEADLVRDRSIGVGGRYWHEWRKTPNLRFSAGLGAYLTHYENQFDYNNDLSRDLLAPLIDGIITNSEVTTLVLAPNVSVDYFKRFRKMEYHLRSHAEVFSGTSLSGGDARPTGWKWINQVAVTRPFTWGEQKLMWQSRFKRIELSQEIEPVMKASHYYEVGTGLVIDTQGKVWFLDNVGLGVNLNVGSAFSGGSIVLLTNVEL